ncbi:MAG TPA: hypothetical protein VGQ85_09500 [Candidatus Limnocylindrales bacterium]|nr:hypothetical protein [Candidatus Limnocylindrales bacterium]
MIVVVGDLRADARPSSAAAIAAHVAALGSTVEIVGLVPGDPRGDRRLLELAKQGVGHAAVLRSPGDAMEAADLELALRYLPGVGTIVLVDDGRGELITTAVAAAAWGAAGLIVVAPSGNATAELPGSALVLQPPAHDPDGTFAGFVAALAIRLDTGEESAGALRSTIAALGVDPVGTEPG